LAQLCDQRTQQRQQFSVLRHSIPTSLITMMDEVLHCAHNMPPIHVSYGQ
jgi:hypothetical protein